uniref:NADH-ubiquinone oxidoreductase chain 4L n=1 Tax=Drilonius striatulus TaxID=341977 RepID=A0A0S2MRA3_9COLE|nr:NADH deshydrogenase subunit 4L [Drilonius striatulus]
MVINYVYSIMLLIGLMVFCLKRKHLLLMLLILEFLVLLVYLMIFLFLVNYNYEYFFSMLYLTMSVCEGSLGLSILVSMIRSFGNDYFHSFNLLW